MDCDFALRCGKGPYARRSQLKAFERWVKSAKFLQWLEDNLPGYEKERRLEFRRVGGGIEYRERTTKYKLFHPPRVETRRSRKGKLYYANIQEKEFSFTEWAIVDVQE